MNILFFIILILTLFVSQTILFPSFTWFSQCFDLLIIVVLYLSLISRRHLVVLPIMLIGAVMDSTSGVPFFLHIFSYLWIYLIVQLVKQLLFQRSLIFLLIISIVSVATQQVLIILSIFIQRGPVAMLELNYGLMIRQIFWGLVIIGPSVWFVNIARTHWLSLTSELKKQMIRSYRGEL